MQRAAAREAIRHYLRDVDRTVAQPLRMGRNGQRLMAEAETQLSALGTVRWEPVGSASCGTSIAGASDVDVVAVFLDPIRHGVDSSVLPYSIDAVRRSLAREEALPEPVPAGEAYDRFAGCLARLPPVAGFGEVVCDFPAVRFPSTTSEPSVEVVPGCEADFLWGSSATRPSSGLVRVAFPARRDRWLGTEPALHGRTLDLSPGGADYTCRELIRLLKVLRYRQAIPIMSYFLEVYALRWLEGSHGYAAASLQDIVAQAGRAWSVRRPDGELVDDIVDILASLAGQVRQCADRRQPFTMIDITTPEAGGTVDATTVAEQMPQAAQRVERVAAAVHAARAYADDGDADAALALWRDMLGMPV